MSSTAHCPELSPIMLLFALKRQRCLSVLLIKLIMT